MRILKDGAVYVVGEVASKALLFLLLPYLTRSLGATAFGELTYFQTFISLLMVFIGLSQDGAVTRYFYFYGRRSIGVLLVGGMAYSFLVATLVLAFGMYFRSTVVCLIALAGLTQSIFEVQLSLRQCQKNVWQYVALQMLASVVSVALTIGLFELVAASVNLRLFAVLISNLCGAVLGWIWYTKSEQLRLRFPPRAYRQGLVYVLVFGAPLFVHNLSFVAKGQFDRLLIYGFFSAKDLGVYAAGAQVAMIFQLLLIALNKAAVPYYYQAMRAGSRGVDDAVRWFKYSLLVVPLPALILSVFPAALFEAILGPDFSGAKYFGVVFVLGFGFNIPYLFLANYFFYHGKNGTVAKCTLTSAILYGVLILIFARIGIKAVPFSLVISNAVTPLLLLWNIRRLK